MNKKKDLLHIGIDFSLNSPGLCIKETDGSYKFVSFFNYGDRVWGEKYLKAFAIHEELIDNKFITGIPYSRIVKDKDHILRERQKIQDAINISNMIRDYLEHYIGDKNVKIGLEGFSYGSKGNSFIDMVMYNAMLRRELASSFGIDNIYIYQPSAVKKLAGKGNCNKHYMINAFQENTLNDNNLSKSKFWKWMSGKDYSKKIPKPIDDLVDSYFIVSSIERVPE